MEHKTWETRIQRTWIFVSAVSLVIPPVLGMESLQNVNFGMAMMILLGVLFTLSLPTSIFVLPLAALFKYGIELQHDEQFGAYFYIILLNIVGYVQWFWLAPRFNNTSKPMTLPTILNQN